MSYTREEIKSCPRCADGFNFFTPEQIAKTLSEIPIASSLCAEEAVYKKRLEICAECEAIREQVLCSHCGCFVMFRARPAKSYCPHPKDDKWNNIKFN